MRCELREVLDEDRAVLVTQWADQVAVKMAAFTAPEHMDGDAFERRSSRLRADATVLNRAIVVDGDVAGTSVRCASSRSAVFASSRLNEISLKRVLARSRN